MYTIENNHLRVNVRSKGAELTSVYDKVNNIEHLWQADPAVWGWHAPVLFPVVGRCLDDQIEIGGQHYNMEKHGFARHADFELVSQTVDSLTFALHSSQQTLAIYPSHFEFYISFELKENHLHQTFEVINKGTEQMHFCIGAHPAFAVPFKDGEHYDDYYLEFDNDTELERDHINADGFFDGRRSKAMVDTNQIPLRGSLFDDDALIFKNLKSRKVTIRSNKNPHTLSVAFKHFKYLGIWAKPNANYVCIEPWQGCADTMGKYTNFSQKEGVLSLPPLGKFDRSIIISVS